MRTVAPLIVFVLVTATPAIAADTGKKHDAMSINAGEIKWGDPPPDIPKGAAFAVLNGDPSKKAPFAIRLKMPAGYKIPPHWHSKDEQLTIVSGSFVLHMGDTMEAPATTLSTGGFHFLPAKSHHAAEATEETIVQIDGMGPFDIHYLNPADNPNPKTAAAVKK